MKIDGTANTQTIHTTHTHAQHKQNEPKRTNERPNERTNVFKSINKFIIPLNGCFKFLIVIKQQQLQQCHKCVVLNTIFISKK